MTLSINIPSALPDADVSDGSILASVISHVTSGVAGGTVAGMMSSDAGDMLFNKDVLVMAHVGGGLGLGMFLCSLVVQRIDRRRRAKARSGS